MYERNTLLNKPPKQIKTRVLSLARKSNYSQNSHTNLNRRYFYNNEQDSSVEKPKKNKINLNAIKQTKKKLSFKEVHDSISSSYRNFVLNPPIGMN